MARPYRKAIGLLVLLLGLALVAGSDPVELDSRVSAALEFTSIKLSAKALNTGLTFQWLDGGNRFWYRKSVTAQANSYWLVDAATGRQTPLFDETAMATALAAAGAPSTGTAPRIHDVSVAQNARTVIVGVPKPTAVCLWPQLYDHCDLPVERYTCDLPLTACHSEPTDTNAERIESPDGRYRVRVQDHNLWLQDRRGGRDRALTTDGLEHDAYGVLHDQIETFAASRRRAGLPEPLNGVRFSPDGRYLLTLRYDVRSFRDRLILTEYLPPEGGPPVIHSKREAAADDPVYPAAQLSVISVADGTTRSIAVDPHLFDDIAKLAFSAGSLWWDRDDLWLLGARRGGLELQLIHVDLRTGVAQPVVREVGQAPLNLHPANLSQNVRVLPQSRQLLWYSERDGWGHLYLYNLDTGRLVRQLTRGKWLVSDLVSVDEGGGWVYFTAGGVEPADNPYYRRLYRVRLAGGSPELLTPEKADHEFTAGHGSFSPNGRYVIDDFSTVSQPNRYVLRGADGRSIAPLAEADISGLQSLGWQPPEPVKVKAADGSTDLYGVLFKPRNLDPSKKYPVIEITYPGSWSKYAPSAFSGVFYGSAVMNAYAMAELGAIVVSIDGRGTSYRSAAFRNFVYGQDDATAAVDHVAAIRNLAATRPYMDLERVGVTGHSSGGDSSLRAAMLYPDFFKVVVSGEGPTDYFGLPMDIAIERPLGVPDNAQRRAYYERIATKNLVGRLTRRNKVLVIYAGADEEVPLQQGFEIFRAFQEANFVYDELIVPDAGHWGGRHPYGVMRTLRYFAEHLGGPT